MVTLSATLIWSGLRHPVRSLQKQLSKRAPVTSEQSSDVSAAATYTSPSPERLERIAAYARCGYFHMEYTAGMFVVPLEIPRE
ncbi:MULTISPECIES: hypothetical protein [Paraburkholderia]|jgi:hypothetical protein|uniref:Uncharacterized protein n=1 Tax=Paraburkholderia madseniana TaxID=2599607 RepID=A0A6N6WFS3_9BURK|nr:MULTISPECIES: hypothetical protein [Paraburkholderia]KAE8759487.1 hypothetical protein FSO04_13280 [Paraburkholderia madseniana]MCX4172352.1 hypothetical protein [Paraburkholderia madseniana]MDQ6460361.1 hypothetical protein [Paraburkholderia madseniana]NPT66523.1 hypothetical protein [Paraburkholderia madseniana]